MSFHVRAEERSKTVAVRRSRFEGRTEHELLVSMYILWKEHLRLTISSHAMFFSSKHIKSWPEERPSVNSLPSRRTEVKLRQAFSRSAKMA